ncbi:hypothetical protein ABL78_5120 [Leptomonas seymouri]|uniref:Uncharacterized protein n=1 Tax=Leptomonas seymouri TaxID=5684 RepID=A0A0N0P4X9_LEPSE|nr:hypothetical protein ABL78_5120 [Leptomonas seymouri]|eukprot:KPI85816.1 hypothetical protein ABL78_5120 [Leptomonas seymouri]
MMRRVHQRRPRKGTDFVLPNVPVLDSPEWSDEEGESESLNVTPQPQPQPVVAAAPAVPTPQMRHSEMMPQNTNPYYNPGTVQQVVVPLPQQRSGAPYLNPGLPHASYSLQLTQQRQQRQTPRLAEPVVVRDRQDHQERPGGGGDRMIDDAINNNDTAGPSRRHRREVWRDSGYRSHAEYHCRDNEDRGKRGAGALGDVRRWEKENNGLGEENYEDDSSDSSSGDSSVDSGEDSGDRGVERHSSFHVVNGSFATAALSSGTRFAGGSLFVHHQGDSEGEEAEEEVSATSGIEGRRLSGDSNNTDEVTYLIQLCNDNGATREQRKPSLFTMASAAGYYPQSDDANMLASNSSNNGTSGSYAVQPTRSCFIVKDGDDDESSDNCVGSGVSAALVGPQSLCLDRSSGPVVYAYGGGSQGRQQQYNGVSDPQDSDSAVGAGTAPANRHGTFFTSTEDARRSRPTQRRSPVGHVDVYPTLADISANLPPPSPVNTPLMNTAKKARSPGPDCSVYHRRSPAPSVSPSRSRSREGNESLALNYDYDMLRENESDTPTPEVSKPAPQPRGRSRVISYASEDERYEQMQQSRFFQSLNDRLTMRKTTEKTTDRAGNPSPSTANGAGEGGAINLSPNGGNSRGSWSSAHSAWGAMTGMAALSSSIPNADRLNFRKRIVPRQQQQPPVQPLSHFSLVHDAPSASATYTPLKVSNSCENSAKRSPGTASLASRRSHNSSDGANTDCLDFSMDTSISKSTTPAAAARETESSPCAADVTSRSAPSTATMPGLSGVEMDEYGLLFWAYPPAGPRRTSVVSVENPSPMAAGTKASHPSPTSRRRTVRPISLLPSSIATSRRPTSTVAGASRPEIDDTTAAAVPALPRNSHSAVQQQELQQLSYEHGLASLFAVSDALSPSKNSCALSVASIMEPNTLDEQRVTDIGYGWQWAPNDDFYFQSAGYSPMAGLQGTFTSPMVQRQRSSFFSDRNDDYFLLNCFRSPTAPQTENGLRGDVVPLRLAATANRSNTNGVTSRSNAARISTAGHLSGSPQRRLNERIEGDGSAGGSGKSEKASWPSSIPQREAVAVVTRLPQVPSKRTSGVSMLALRGLEDYGFSADLDNASFGDHYEMKCNEGGYSYLPTVSGAALSEAPLVSRNASLRHSRPSEVCCNDDSLAPTSVKQGTPRTTNPGGIVKKQEHRRRRLLSSSADERSAYCNQQHYHQPLQQRRLNSREAPRRAQLPKAMILTKRKAERGEDQSSRRSPLHASLSSPAVAQSRKKKS